MSNDRLRQMEIYRAVVDAGGFYAAARRLGISQSSVSKAISALEQRLGVALIIRTTRDQRLSLEGERFLYDCRKALDMIETAEDGAKQEKKSVSGYLKISVPVSFGLDQINPLLPGFMALHPELSIELSVTDRVENIVDGQIDVAIRMGKLIDSNLVQRKLCGLDRLIVAAPSYLAQHGTPESLADLEMHNCLLWKENADHLNDWPLYQDNQRIKFRASGNFYSNNGMALATACLDGIGIMRMGDHIAKPLVHAGRLVELMKKFRRPDNHSIYIVFQKEKLRLARVRSFVEFISEQLGKASNSNENFGFL